MRNFARTFALAAALSAAPYLALAQSEVFKIESSGTEYCGDFDARKFNPGNNVDLWVRLSFADQWDVSFFPDFPEDFTFPLPVRVYFVTQKKLAFTGWQFFDDGSFVGLSGTATLDNQGLVKSATGTFSQDGLVVLECFSSGKWKTGKRIFP